jgi:hypothetical protein
MAQQAGLFTRLTKLFRSGPVIKRSVRNVSSQKASTALEVFKRAHSDVYNSTLSAYGAFDRMSRYSDFSEMEGTPEIASALDIYAEETVASDEHGRVLHIYSDNRKIQELLDNLFYDVLNVEFNLVMWARNLCKYGDFFLFNDVHPDFGVINAYPIAISEMEREDGFDPEDPMAVRFRWVTQGNQVLENWQVSHFRLLGNDAFLPYGSSVLESARRIWRQLILIEDAMLVYRVIRAPERRVFYIDVGNVPPEDVANYLEQAQTSLKRNQVVDKDNGKVDLRYNPLSVDEDYFLPVRGGESGTRIDTLAGGQNTAAIEDVEYIQKKLFAALKIPKAYLGYDEDVGSKATLAQEDIRFSRTIQRIQKTVISEMNKLAMVHLYCHGYTEEDLADFELRLSNPSSVAQQQKLELIRARFEIAGTAPEGSVNRGWIQKNVLGLTDDEIRLAKEGRVQDKLEDLEVEAQTAPVVSAPAGAPPDAGGDEAPAEEMGDEAGEEAAPEDLFAADKPEGSLLTALPSDPDNDEDFDLEIDDEVVRLSIKDLDAPIKAEKQIKNAFGQTINKSRKVRNGPATTHMPDFVKMTGTGRTARHQDTSNKPFDNDFLKDPFSESHVSSPPRLTFDLVKTLGRMTNKIGIDRTTLLSEDKDPDGGPNGEA